MKFNIKNISLTAWLFVLPLILPSCIYDSYDDLAGEDVVPVPDNEPIGFMSIKVMTNNGDDTRALGDEFYEGEGSEVSLSSEAKHYSIFYNPELSEYPIAVGELSGISKGSVGDKRTNTSVVFASIVGRAEEKETLTKLKECFIILNCNIPPEEMWGATQDDLMKITLGSPFFYDSKGHRYFTMCNSVYVENGQKKIYTTVDTDKIYTSALEAMEQAWKGNAAVNAYVERLAAKFSLVFDNEAYNSYGTEKYFPLDNSVNTEMIVFQKLVNDIPYYSKVNANGQPYQYRIQATGWGVNAIEQSTFLFRRFNPQGGYFTGWFNPEYKRVYWSEDPNYGRDTYPFQYRKVIDNTGLPVYENGNNILRNFSYEEMNENRFFEPYLYSPENTYDFADLTFMNSLDGRPDIVAGTHLVLCTQLQTNVRGTDFRADDIYRDRNGNFYLSELDCAKALVTIMNNTLESHSFLKFTYWNWDQGGVEEQLFASTAGSYGLYYKGRKVDANYIETQLVNDLKLSGQNGALTDKAEFKGSDGKCIIWFKDLTIQDQQGNTLKIYSNIDEVDPTKNKYLREATINDLKSVIFSHVGALDHFKDGRMYYQIPIGLVESGNQNSANTQYSVYGVVRNNEYTIKVLDIKGIGSAVDNPDQPIVGTQASTRDHLFIDFEILNWHNIGTTVPGLIN